MEHVPCTTPYNTAAQTALYLHSLKTPPGLAVVHLEPELRAYCLTALPVLADEPVISLNRISFASGVYKVSQESS